jgi:hypothetical protein
VAVAHDRDEWAGTGLRRTMIGNRCSAGRLLYRAFIGS